MIKLRFERPQDDVVGPALGPFEWVQITYATICVAPDGKEVAALDSDEYWHVNQTDERWSDVIIS